MKRTNKYTALILLSTLIGGNAMGNDNKANRCTTDLETYRSMVVHDGGDWEVTRNSTLPDNTQAILNDKPILNADFWSAFSMERTLQTIVRTDPQLPEEVGDAEVHARTTDLAQSFIDTLNLTSMEKSGVGSFDVNTLDPFLLLDIDDLMDAQPVALFNRLDLASENGETCGEHRIVYSISSTQFLIFEGMIGNPNWQQNGAGGCAPLFKQWLQASHDPNSTDIMAPVTVNKDGTLTADTLALQEQLEEIYYSGFGDLQPAMAFNHLGGIHGQVRSNILTNGKWILGQWRVSNEISALAPPVMTRTEVSGHLLTELFTGSNEAIPTTVEINAPRGTTALEFWSGYRTGFLDMLLHDTGEALVNPELERIEPSVDHGRALIGAMRSENNDPFSLHPDLFTEFQSSETDTDGFTVSDDAITRLNCWIDATATDTPCTSITAVPPTDGGALTTEHLENRYLTAGTCTGCHMVEANAIEVAPGVAFPPSGHFVHVGGNGNLSEALHGTFLPGRKSAMLANLAKLPAGDINMDGFVNGQDLGLLFSDWGNEGVGVPGDINCDGILDGVDVGDLLANWTPSAPSGLGASPLETLQDHWKTSSEKQKSRIQVQIQAERDRIRTEAQAAPGLDGQQRPRH